VVKLGGSGSFRVSGGVVGRLRFRVGVSASYSCFRRIRNFDFVYTAAVSVPLALIICTGHATRCHFVLVTARGLGRRTLKTITHHSQPHTERSVYQVCALSPASLSYLYMLLPLLLKTKWRPWPDSQQPNWSRDLSLYTGLGLGRPC